MQKKWLLLIVFLLVACSSKVPVESPVIPNVTNTTPEPVEVEEKLAQFVVATTGTVEGFDVFKLKVGEIELYDKTKDSWKKLSSEKVSVDIVANENPQLVIDVQMPPQEFTQMRFKLDAEATKDNVEYDGEIPYGTITLPITLKLVETHPTGVLLTILPGTVRLVGESAYITPSLKAEVWDGVEIMNRTVTFTTLADTVVRSSDELFTVLQLNTSRESCIDDCSDACDTADDDCGAGCEDAVTAGCEAEDEDFCRDACNVFMHPVYCRDGCQEGTIDECQDYLVPRCTSTCSDDLVACKAACAVTC